MIVLPFFIAGTELHVLKKLHFHRAPYASQAPGRTSYEAGLLLCAFLLKDHFS